MAALGHYKSLPEAYEATLMTKMTRDDDSVEMLRIVNEGLALDFGYVYDIGGISTMFRSLAIDGLPFVSEYEKVRSNITADINKLIETFKQ